MNTKDNQRAQNSITSLSIALLELAERSGGRRITVKQVCQRAGVNRSTFYAHFRDIYDIVENAQQVLLRELRGELAARGPEGTLTADGFFAALLEHIRRHRYFYGTLLQSDLGFSAQQGLIAAVRLLREHVVDPWCQSAGITDPMEAEYYAAYCQAGLDAVLRRWLRGGCGESDQQMLHLLRGCAPSLLNGTADTCKR